MWPKIVRKVFLGIILLAACSNAPVPSPTAEPTATDVPPNTPEPTSTLSNLPTLIEIEVNGYSVSYEQTPCNLDLSTTRVFECGKMTVPENRDDPEGPKVVLPVVIFRSDNPKPDPVFYLAGGGGYDHMAAVQWLLDRTWKILQDRDYIMYNQRGAPNTEPSLFCPGYADFLRELYSKYMSDADFDARHVEFLLACHDALVAEGHDLNAYNSAVNAADLNDLRLVLGFDQINIYGSSYGTKLGLTVLRDYPEGIRSAILDSVYPPQVDLYVPYMQNAYDTLQILFEDCKADTDCNAKYPNLEAELYQAVDKLNADPKTIKLNSGEFVLNGSRFLFALSFYFYGSANLPNLPAAIYQANQGEFDLMTRLFPAMWSVDVLSWGMFFSMQCREEISFTTPEEMAAMAEAYPQQLAGFFASPFRFPMCDSWQVEKAALIENEAVFSDIPTLVFGGRYDLETPSKWGALISKTLTNSYFYEFPGVAHGVMRSNSCALDIGLDFLDDPTVEPDSSCLADEEPPTFR